jgi:hypothetical protein
LENFKANISSKKGDGRVVFIGIKIRRPPRSIRRLRDFVLAFFEIPFHKPFDEGEVT